MSTFDRETAIHHDGDGRWGTELSTGWNIGESANGGYAMSAVLRALTEVGGHPDPISVTTHFLRPVQGGGVGRIDTELVRRGRTVSVARGTLYQGGADRLTVVAALGDLGEHPEDVSGSGVGGSQPALDLPAPAIPPPDDCIGRTGADQGVELPILERCEIRVAPDRTTAGGSDDAVSDGWIRLRDGSEPTALTLPLFADAFPPSLFSKFGRVGWVPTIELTVHVRRRPAPGWVRARFECDDLVDGRMIESGTLWDSTGRVVARSRQLGLMLT